VKVPRASLSEYVSLSLCISCPVLNSITQVIAGTTTVGQEEFRFLDVAQPLWTPSSGEKLKGKLSWPFSIPIPKTVEAEHEEKGPKSKYTTPPTFTERASPAYLDYKLVATVKRGAFKVDQKYIRGLPLVESLLK
jgi:hypothetical protein